MAEEIVQLPRHAKDISGQRFGKLLVRRFAGQAKNGSSIWECLCDCGIVTSVNRQSLRDGHTRSCGCLARAGTHRLTKTQEYRIWHGMKQRCLNENDTGYHAYGAKGVRVCQHWRESFVAFFTDMGRRPSKRHSIDRKDNSGHYSCGKCEECKANGWIANCRWATSKEQMRNFCRNRCLALNGVTRTVAGWAELTGLSDGTILSRLDRGWSVEDALTKPSKCRPIYLEYAGERLTLHGWSQKTGVPVGTIANRHKRGLPPEEVLSKSPTLGGRPTYLEHNGLRLHIAEWSRRTGIPTGTILHRVRKLGWSVERALSISSKASA